MLFEHTIRQALTPEKPKAVPVKAHERKKPSKPAKWQETHAALGCPGCRGEG